MSTTGWIILGIIVVVALWAVTIYNNLVAMALNTFGGPRDEGSEGVPEGGARERSPRGLAPGRPRATASGTDAPRPS